VRRNLQIPAVCWRHPQNRITWLTPPPPRVYNIPVTYRVYLWWYVWNIFLCFVFFKILSGMMNVFTDIYFLQYYYVSCVCLFFSIEVVNVLKYALGMIRAFIFLDPNPCLRTHFGCLHVSGKISTHWFRTSNQSFRFLRILRACSNRQRRLVAQFDGADASLTPSPVPQQRPFRTGRPARFITRTKY